MYVTENLLVLSIILHVASNAFYKNMVAEILLLLSVFLLELTRQNLNGAEEEFL